jgi:hypothetical protein
MSARVGACRRTRRQLFKLGDNHTIVAVHDQVEAAAANGNQHWVLEHRRIVARPLLDLRHNLMVFDNFMKRATKYRRVRDT